MKNWKDCELHARVNNSRAGRIGALGLFAIMRRSGGAIPRWARKVPAMQECRGFHSKSKHNKLGNKMLITNGWKASQRQRARKIAKTTFRCTLQVQWPTTTD